MDLSQIVSSVLGSAIGTTLIGVWFKSRFDRQLENQKAVLQRASRVHDRQVEALSTLYATLHETQSYLQLMTKQAIFEGEKPDEYPQLFSEAAKKAYDRFV